MIELAQIKPFLANASPYENGSIVLHIKSISHTDIEIIKDLFSTECCNTIIKNSQRCATSDLQEGDMINLEINIHNLKKYGYYIYLRDYIKKCQTIDTLAQPAYIQEISSFANREDHEILLKIDFALRFIREIRQCYCVQNGNAVLIPSSPDIIEINLQFSDNDIKEMSLQEDSENIIKTFCDTHNILSKIYQNEFNDFFIQQHETKQNLGSLLKVLSDYNHKCNCCIELYVKQFSFKDIKAQIDKSVLEYSDKLQTVVVNAQGRLIAIPAAFVLSVASIDRTAVWSIMNIAVVIGVIIFIILIDIFIKNQKDALYTIDKSINEYKSNFQTGREGVSINKEITDRFQSLNEQLRTQKSRLNLIRIIIYCVPLPILFFIINFEYIQTIFDYISSLLSLGIAFIASIFYLACKIIIMIL
mgnify:CR=1 FL=1